MFQFKTTCFCHDHNYHGGSIIIFVKSHFIGSKINIFSYIELILYSVKFKHSSFTLGSKYHPLSSVHDLDCLSDERGSLNPSV